MGILSDTSLVDWTHEVKKGVARNATANVGNHGVKISREASPHSWLFSNYLGARTAWHAMRRWQSV